MPTSVIGLASGIGGSHSGSGQGPLLLQQQLLKEGTISWKKMIFSDSTCSSKANEIAKINTELAKAVYESVKKDLFTMVIGGDHSCGMGTWSGVATALFEERKQLGLIWLDAHMDCHTMKTSPSGNIHGMPVASLLGYGNSSFCEILSKNPKVLPENLFLVGIRSFEPPEKALVEKLGIRVYYVEEVLERGLKAILTEILSYFKKRRISYGISLDIDFFDPKEMPASGTTEENGIHPSEFLDCCTLLEEYRPILFEYVEFNPPCDKENSSLNWSIQILKEIIKLEKLCLQA